MTEILPEYQSQSVRPTAEFYEALQHSDFGLRTVEKLARRLIQEAGLHELEDAIVSTAITPNVNNEDSLHAAQEVCTFPLYDLGPTMERMNVSTYGQNTFMREYYIDAHNNASWLVSSLHKAKMRRSEQDYAAAMQQFQAQQADFFLNGVRDPDLDGVEYLVDPRSAYNYAGVRLEVARATGLVSTDEADAIADKFSDTYTRKFGRDGR